MPDPIEPHAAGRPIRGERDASRSDGNPAATGELARHHPAPEAGGTLLGGRVLYRQLPTGHRTGMEPVLLSASVPARPGEHVLEGGTGAGAGLLCLLHRLPGVRATGIEAAPDLAALARDNIARNGFAARGAVAETILPALPAMLGRVSHAFANPPWFDAAGTTPADAARRLARTLPPGAIADWTIGLGRPVETGGTLALIVPAASHADWSAAMRRAGFGAIVLVPLWPRAGRDARIVILRGRRGARGADRIASGLVLHGADGRHTRQTDTVLRDGAAFPGS